jgi:hypothetical protein
MFRQNTYNEAEFFQLVPIHRQAVVPGQSVELDLDINFETPPFLGNIMSGGIASAYAYYVPNRLVVPTWMDFIADPDSGITLPKSANPWPLMFEHPIAGYPVNVMFRRGYKLVYNQFFGNKDYGVGAWYDDTHDDAEVTTRGLRTNDQWLGKLIRNAEVPDVIMEVPVAGAIASISLNELRANMQIAKQMRRAEMTGDKYVDAMLRMGVKLDWRVQMAPEFLGAAHKEFQPKDTRATYSATVPAPDGANAGQSFSRYQDQFQMKVPRKFFAEHGYIMVLLAVRPFAFNAAFRAPADATPLIYKNWFLGENQVGVDQWNAGQFSAEPDTTQVFSMSYQHLLSGHNMRGQYTAGGSWVPVDQSVGIDDAIFIEDFNIASTDQIEHQMAVFTRIRSGGPTPVKQGVI